jgi:hypothetical protein
LDFLSRNFQLRRTSINHNANAAPVGFTKGSDTKQMPESVAHFSCSPLSIKNNVALSSSSRKWGEDESVSN